MSITILHQDEAALAVDKPAGMTVIPARGEPPEACLQHRLEAQLGRRLWVVHRIDRDTSGLVLFALDAAAHRALCGAFEARAVDKRYLALASGALPAAEGEITLALHPARKGKTRPAAPAEPGAQAATTRYRVRRAWRAGDGRSVSLVEAQPLTGRHHQIRVHLRAVDAPILGDPLYGKRTLEGALAAAPCPRLALHAERLVVPSPSGEAGAPPLELLAPLPPDLAALSAWLDAKLTLTPQPGA